MSLMVYYGFTKLNKICKKRELAIYFENAWSPNSEEWIAKRCVIAAKRKQTEAEANDGRNYTRVYAKYSIYIDDKPFNSDIKRVLEHNKTADSKNVEEVVLNDIYQKLLEKFREYNLMYPAPQTQNPKYSNQLQFEFNQL